ncbi:SIMPL domain-containing protein [Ferruginibacter sp. SUN002]|uniref:SIMPL domain-containing protein n=1 Tax=Ferruginibacter sp. SUN002 TaxID=2937789 RepID=UPI003D36C446
MKENSFLKPAIIGLAIILTAFILGSAFKNRNATDDSISVTGLGSKDFISDEISWSGSFNTKAMEAKDAYNLINDDKEKVKAFFISKGFKENEFSFGGVNFNQSYRTITIETDGNTTKTEQIFDGYTATQSVNFISIKNPELMKKIENVIDHTAELINSGIQFNSNSVQYTYSDLPSLKHNLIEKATQDAKERAQKIVKTGEGDLGKLKDASMGVFQITGKGSVEEDSYGGNNDTYSKAKTARITVRLTYELE